MARAHGCDLRRGRFSEGGRVYLVTTVVRERRPVFADWLVGRQLVRTLREMDAEGHCETLAFVVMPDHLHWLLALTEGTDLSTLLRLLKGRSARRIGLMPGHGLWQKGFHDHAARQDEDVVAMARYVVANPLRAGLVEKLGDYPLWDATYV